ncbi:Transposon TX1 uncharacterized 149 kDa protein [Vitis vinifera]|uniref:Transposon TX1 uncharacterized 149 kDa protein n=1 Tax=Vitis vinifera TaxID=29760 RepID=A0A438KMU7_VITVI|nr:Transposon TX1 uncharacterized 149 kDa protein [Vitis vinifera]
MGEALSPELEPSTLPLEGFQVEGLTPRKMVKVQSVLESLRIRIVRDNGKGVEGENKSALSADKILSWNTRGLGSRKKRRIVRRFLSTQNPDVVMLQETKREIWDRRSVSSVWKGRSLEWAALPALYGPNKPLWRKDFWLELRDLYGLTFLRWCVGGDFNVIRRISEKMGDSRLTVNMRCFDEFIRESGLLDPPLRNASFTWSNIQVDPICKMLDRFENMWLLHPEFKEKFRDWWQECTVEGWEGHKFMRKLKVATGRRNRKFIKSLISERGETLSNIEVISVEIVNFFENLYSKPEGDSWRIEEIDWAPISGESAVWLDRQFSEEEVRMAVFQLNKEKTPDPDGFTIAVYQECWDVIKEDLMRVFFEFHTKGVINQSTNATFIAMVPKKSQTFKISDYRPISLVTSLYKIIAKVLSGRLRKVLHETSFGSQGVFVEGRQILDAVLTANEVVDEKRRSGEEWVVFKIDFEKAYDHVDWGFLDHVLQRKGFSQKWRSWMRGCLSSSSFAILVNGNAKGCVKASRGFETGRPSFSFPFYSSSRCSK